MSNDLVQQNSSSPTPFTRAMSAAPGINAGAVAIESERAIAEAQGQLILAKRFPRDLNAAYAELMESCKMPAMANVAFYALPRGGKTISGPSVRLAEEIARVFGNFEYGHRELSRSNGKSEVEVYAWDKQTNNRSIRQITVMHTLDTREGQKPLRDQKDIDDKIANVASKQVRGRILAMMPKWMLEAAMEECRKTLAGTNEAPISERVRKMTQAFAKFGINTNHIERKLGHKLDNVTDDELVDLLAIYNAIRDGGEKASEFFPAEQSDEAAPAPAAAKAIADASASTQKKTAAASPAKSKPAAASNPVKDEAPAPVEEPAQAEADQTVNPEATDQEAANAAAADAAADDDVF